VVFQVFVLFTIFAGMESRAAKPTQNALPQSVAFQLSNWQDVSARVLKSEF